MTEGIIYRYKSPSGKYYIGQTIDEYSRRTAFLNVNVRYGGSKIDRARRKYGPENFEYTVLMKVTGDNPEEVKPYLDTLEICFIRMYDSFKNGYNLTEGGGVGTLGYHHTDETKEHLRVVNIGNKYNLGHNRSEETRRKISESNKGKTVSEESKRKNSESHKGKTVWNKGVTGWTKKKQISDESRERYREAARKRGISDETRKKINESNKGRHRVYNPDGTYRMVK